MVLIRNIQISTHNTVKDFAAEILLPFFFHRMKKEEAMLTLIQLAKHHPEVVQENTTKIAFVLCNEVKNFRQSVAGKAILTIGHLYEIMGKHFENVRTIIFLNIKFIYHIHLLLIIFSFNCFFTYFISSKFIEKKKKNKYGIKEITLNNVDFRGVARGHPPPSPTNAMKCLPQEI